MSRKRIEELRIKLPAGLQDFSTFLKERYAAMEGQIGVAVSGGADSVFLARILHDAGLAGRVLHVNHQLRGRESDDDEAFVVALAGELGLPVSVTNLPPVAGNLEQEARNARYMWLRGFVEDGTCACVATGHTQDDQAETVLSRFLRGAGTAGLAGVLPEVDGIVRPLLGLSRGDVRRWLRERNAAWREDTSNQDLSFLRNRLRQEVMPVLCGINPSLSATLAVTAEWAQGEEEYWKAEVDRVSAPHLVGRDGVVLTEISWLRTLPLALQRRVIRRAIYMVRNSLRSMDFRHVEAIRALTHSGEGSGRLQLPGLDIYRSFDWLRLAPVNYDSRLERDFETPLSNPGITVLPERRLAIEMKQIAGNDVYNSDLHAIDPAKVTGDLRLRNWRPGDSLQVCGASGVEKIKSLFQENRIPLWERRTWPVVVAGRSIVWTRRFGVAAEFAAVKDSSQALLIREVSGLELAGT